MINVVKEIPDPFEGQQAYAQNGTLCVYRKGRWISMDEDKRGLYIGLTRTIEAHGDCV